MCESFFLRCKCIQLLLVPLADAITRIMFSKISQQYLGLKHVIAGGYLELVHLAVGTEL